MPAAPGFCRPFGRLCVSACFLPDRACGLMAVLDDFSLTTDSIQRRTIVLADLRFLVASPTIFRFLIAGIGAGLLASKPPRMNLEKD